MAIVGELLDALQEAQRVVAFSGAGMSAESGIPTFRDQMTGLWANYKPEEMATPSGYLTNPALVFDWYTMRYQRVINAQPNAGHRALAALAQHVPSLTIITQNTDDLHERAGSQNVMHLHGSLMHLRCFDCNNQEEWGVALSQHISPPVCLHCGGTLRPATVMFGESLPLQVFDHATKAAASCDVMLVIGTTGLVYPASELPYLAKQNRAVLVQVNPDARAQGPEFDFRLTGGAASMLPALLKAAFA